MKRLFLAILVISVIIAFDQKLKDYVMLSGTITGQNSDSLMVMSRTFKKRIAVNENGTFSDTFKVKKGDYILFDGTETTSVFFENGFDLNLNLDTKAFDETITYTGVGSKVNNYLAQKALLTEKLTGNFSLLFDLEKSDFNKKVNIVLESMKSLLASTKKIESSFFLAQNQDIEGLKEYIINLYMDTQYTKTILGKGRISPIFSNYENIKGGTTSLEDLKGKFVYIDVWATWCGPCKKEIPYLKDVEKAYHDKNIEFVSISVDKTSDKNKWKTMIAEKKLGGIQLLADKDFESDFVVDYVIKGIPRFILIDNNGNIVSADAPRPSDEKLLELFNSLGI